MNYRTGLQPFGLVIGICLIALGFFAPKEFWAGWKPGLISFGILTIGLLLYNLIPFLALKHKKNQAEKKKQQELRAFFEWNLSQKNNAKGNQISFEEWQQKYGVEE